MEIINSALSYSRKLCFQADWPLTTLGHFLIVIAGSIHLWFNGGPSGQLPLSENYLF